jgi:K+-sensing histidine kinase KdpD
MVPIRTEQPVGAIGTYWASPHRASADEIELLATLANSTSIALENVQLYEQLEERVEQRTADLVRVQRQKEELAALIVHDLRSPANGIMLASRLRMRHKDATETDRAHWRNVYSSAEAIHRMAMNLLDVMRSEDGTFVANKSDVAMQKLINEVVEQMVPLASSQAIELRVESGDDLPTISCDQELMRRVLQNLTENALRYSGEGTKVTIAARVIDADIELRVIDEGPGIPVDQRESVFDKWKRLQGGKEKSTSGRGLGLAFCRLATAAHGGCISIESHEPRGTEFVVRLPRSR